MSKLASRHIKNFALDHTIVRRRGVKAKEWYDQTEIVIASRPKTVNDDRALKFHFIIPAGGQGQTAIEMLIKPEDFPILLQFMSATDPQATLKAMAEELRYQLCGASNSN
jgi:hypothetical protein